MLFLGIHQVPEEQPVICRFLSSALLISKMALCIAMEYMCILPSCTRIFLYIVYFILWGCSVETYCHLWSKFLVTSRTKLFSRQIDFSLARLALVIALHANWSLPFIFIKMTFDPSSASPYRTITSCSGTPHYPHNSSPTLYLESSPWQGSPKLMLLMYRTTYSSICQMGPSIP